MTENHNEKSLIPPLEINLEQALKNLENMWNKFMAFDNKWANHYKRNMVLRLTNAKGRLGLASTKTFYRLSHSVVRFN